MRTRETPPLSKEGVAELLTEMNSTPADTPERRATLDRARSARFLVEQAMSGILAPKNE